MKKLLLLLLFLLPNLVSAQTGQFIPFLRSTFSTSTNSTTTNMAIIGITGCNTTSALTTNTVGAVVCGAISGSGSGGSKWATSSSDTRFIQPNSATGIISTWATTTNATSTTLYVSNDAILSIAGGATGVGTTTPTKLLHVSFTDNTAPIDPASFNGIRVGNISAVVGSGAAIQFSNGVVGGALASITSRAVGSDRNALDFGTEGTAGRPVALTLDHTQFFGIGSTSPWGLLSVNASGTGIGVPSFVVGSSTKTDFIITSAGRTGLGGTTTPQNVLTVSGGGVGVHGASSYVSSGLFLGYGTNFADTGSITAITPGNTYRDIDIDGKDVSIRTGTGAVTDALTVESSGEVGIGDNTPSDKLLIAEDSGYMHFGSPITGYMGVTFLDAAVSTANYALIGNTSGQVFLGRPTGQNIFFRENNSDQMVLETGGDLGIASSTPWGKLSVTNTGTDPSFVVEDQTSPDSTPFLITAAGLVGIGDPTPQRLLSVLGTDTNTNGLTVTQTAVTRHINFSAAEGRFVGDQYCFDDVDAQCLSMIGSRFISTGNQWTGTFSVGVKNEINSTNVTERLTVMPFGNVGLSTTSPWWTLHIASSTPYIGITDTTAPVGGKNWIIGNVDGMFTIGTTSDNVMLPTMSTSTALSINGNTASTTFSIGSTSVMQNTTLVVQGPSANSTTKGTCFRAKAVGSDAFVFWYYTTAGGGTQTVTTTSCMGNGTTTVTYD